MNKVLFIGGSLDGMIREFKHHERLDPIWVSSHPDERYYLYTRVMSDHVTRRYVYVNEDGIHGKG